MNLLSRCCAKGRGSSRCRRHCDYSPMFATASDERMAALGRLQEATRQGAIR
jgi:hypothetical protein